MTVNVCGWWLKQLRKLNQWLAYVYEIREIRLRLLYGSALNSVKEMDGIILKISRWKAYNDMSTTVMTMITDLWPKYSKTKSDSLPMVIHIVTKVEVHTSSSSWDNER